MDLIDRLKQLSERITKLRAQVATEEATKNAFVLPFLQALGYDVFNPLEVTPEFTADIGTKKGEKVDYCIRCELNFPGEEFVRYIVQRVYSGRATAKVVEQFTDIVQRSTKALLSDMINQRLQSAIEQETEQPPAEPEPEPPEIETTEDELQAFRIVQAILVRRVDSSRIAHRDHKTYFSVLLDDNNRKPICRLHFNTSNRYLELFDEQKNGHKVQIESLGDIYNYSELLLNVVEAYDGVGG